MTATTTRWFTRHRSLAVALVSAGISVGAATVGPLARWIITGYDWQTAMFVIGELALVTIIPAALFVREPPVPVSVAGIAEAAGAEGREFTVGSCGRTRACCSTPTRAAPARAAGRVDAPAA